MGSGEWGVGYFKYYLKFFHSPFPYEAALLVFKRSLNFCE
jgi:hypothetical protein